MMVMMQGRRVLGRAVRVLPARRCTRPGPVCMVWGFVCVCKGHSEHNEQRPTARPTNLHQLHSYPITTYTHIHAHTDLLMPRELHPPERPQRLPRPARAHVALDERSPVFVFVCYFVLVFTNMLWIGVLVSTNME